MTHIFLLLALLSAVIAGGLGLASLIQQRREDWAGENGMRPTR